MKRWYIDSSSYLHMAHIPGPLIPLLTRLSHIKIFFLNDNQKNNFRFKGNCHFHIVVFYQFEDVWWLCHCALYAYWVVMDPNLLFHVHFIWSSSSFSLIPPLFNPYIYLFHSSVYLYSNPSCPTSIHSIPLYPLSIVNIVGIYLVNECIE